MPPAYCDLIFRIPLSEGKTKTPPEWVVFLFWQRMRDSNPRERSQSPVCYRYTNPLCVRHGSYYNQNPKKVKDFFPIPETFFSISQLAFFIPVPRETVSLSVPHGEYRKRSASPLYPGALSAKTPVPAAAEGASGSSLCSCRNRSRQRHPYNPCPGRSYRQHGGP